MRKSFDPWRLFDWVYGSTKLINYCFPFSIYTVVRRHMFDGKGGDVDIHCTRKRTMTSPFETGDVNLYVQVKKHDGKTDEEAVTQLIRMLENEPLAEGCVMSAADGFSEKAKRINPPVNE